MTGRGNAGQKIFFNADRELILQTSLTSYLATAAWPAKRDIHSEVQSSAQTGRAFGWIARRVHALHYYFVGGRRQRLSTVEVNSMPMKILKDR